MDRIEIEKKFPQLVEVVNELKARIETSESNPLNITFPSSFVGGSDNDQYIRVSDVDAGDSVYVKPASNSVVNGFITCVHVLNNSFGYVFPINQNFYHLTSSKFTTTIVPSLYASFSERFPSATSIVVFYNYQNSGRAYTFGSYNGD